MVGRLQSRLAKLEKSYAALTARVARIAGDETAPLQGPELFEMTIDWVQWYADYRPGGEAKTALLCHVVERNGWDAMKLFTQKADSAFGLEADGYPTIPATMSVGGINSTDGSTRFVMLYPSRPLDPSAAYRLRPRNQREKHRWMVAPDLVVKARPTSG